LLLITVSAPPLLMPPPLPPPAAPRVSVIPRMVTFAPVATLKMRTVLLPLTVVLAAPLPLIVSAPAFARSGSALASTIVPPLVDAAKVIVSAAGLALASRIAWRSEPAPASLRVVTLNVAASAGRASQGNRPRASIANSSVAASVERMFGSIGFSCVAQACGESLTAKLLGGRLHVQPGVTPACKRMQAGVT